MQSVSEVEKSSHLPFKREGTCELDQHNADSVSIVIVSIPFKREGTCEPVLYVVSG